MCSARLTFTDVYSGEDVLILEDSDIFIDANNISFSVEALETNIHYMVTVEASNVVGVNRSHFNLSKCVEV